MKNKKAVQRSVFLRVVKWFGLIYDIQENGIDESQL